MAGKRSPLVLAISLNPALDITYRVERLEVGAEQRVRTIDVVAGGKAVNVARVLAALGHPVTLCGFVGGPSGATLRRGLAEAGVDEALVDIAAETRRTVTVVDDAGEATGLWEPGPVVTPPEWVTLRSRLGDLMEGCAVLVLAGSLPMGVPSDAWATLTRLGHEVGIPVVVDTDGAALMEVLTSEPDVIKPNRSELLRAAPPPLGAPTLAVGPWADEIAAAERLRLAGAGAVVVSAGAEGMVAVTKAGTWSGAPPEVVRGNATGAGDATVAALARGLAQGASWPEMLADSLALGAAAVVCGTGGMISLVDYEAWRPLTAVGPVAGVPCPS